MLLYRSPAFAMRSIVGVGMTPPNVLGTPKPESSVIMSRIFGASLGGHDAWRPPSFGFEGVVLDHAAEFRVGCRQLFAAEGSGGARRTRLTSGVYLGRDARGGREYERSRPACSRHDSLCFHTL